MARPVINLRKYFTLKAIAQRLERGSVQKTAVVDTVFPANSSHRRTHALPVVGIDTIKRVVRAAPVVRRGGQSLPMRGRNRAINYIEPQGVDLSDFLGAVDLNNLRMLDDRGIDQHIGEIEEDMRATIRLTTEALASQSLRGSISHAMAVDGGAMDTYEVAFGDPLAINPDSPFDDSGFKAAQLLSFLTDVEAEVQESAMAGGLIHWLGKDAFAAAVAIVQGLTSRSAIRAEIRGEGDQRVIDFAGFLLRQMNESYYDPTTGTMVKKVAPNEMVTIALDARHLLLYVSLDDLNGNFQALPFLSYPIEETDPNGYKIVGKSKPFPITDPKAIAWSEVLPA